MVLIIKGNKTISVLIVLVNLLTVLKDNEVIPIRPLGRPNTFVVIAQRCTSMVWVFEALNRLKVLFITPQSLSGLNKLAISWQILINQRLYQKSEN